AFMIGEFYSTITDLTKDDKRFIENMLIDWGGTPDPNHILTFGKNPVSYQIASGQQKNEYLQKNHLRLVPNALFSYIDHLEIVEARKAAKEAKQLSIVAIVISSLLAIAQIIFAFKFDY